MKNPGKEQLLKDCSVIKKKREKDVIKGQKTCKGNELMEPLEAEGYTF